MLNAIGKFVLGLFLLYVGFIVLMFLMAVGTNLLLSM